MFINPEGGDTEIEFNDQFNIWQEDTLIFSEEVHKVLYTVTGLKVINGDIFLTGKDYNLDGFNDLELEEVWDLYELAHILDALTAGHYKVLVTTEE